LSRRCWIVESHPSLFCRAEFIERIERGNDLHAITGILFDLGKPLQHRDVFGANLFRQIVRLFDEDFERGGIVSSVRLSYLLIELYYIALLLKFRFIAADDFDDLLNLPQCWLRGVWLRSALLQFSKRRHRGESRDDEDKFELHDRVPRLCSGTPGDVRII
jgi:hypothetical protein